LIFLEIDAKGGEGALECFDLGGAYGFLMELIRFLLPLATNILICVELYWMDLCFISCVDLACHL
jgi:hypothetical protein